MSIKIKRELFLVLRVRSNQKYGGFLLKGLKRKVFLTILPLDLPVNFEVQVMRRKKIRVSFHQEVFASVA